ncbi:MAG: carbon starvation protein A [Candidatus Riflebacteria bacterium]|nr:carbon starvation protein A [Candidatus Riflebacteria bacterium]
MISFIVAAFLLINGYILYGSFLEKVFDVSAGNKVPSETKYDGVDFVPLDWKKAFLIQLLNIAGLGPVFGAILGALWGPIAYIWIIFGAVFIGATHDFAAGQLSLRENGASINEIIGKYLGNNTKKLMTVWTLFLLMIVGAVFVMGPARIMADMATDSSKAFSNAESFQEKAESAPISAAASNTVKPIYATLYFWAFVIFAYYILATLFPIDAIIGKIYPFFGLALIMMALFLTQKILTGVWVIPELTLDTFRNINPSSVPIWPVMMITITCGAVSGFHATQSPMIARVLTSEKYSRRVFFGAMITESFIALVWAAAAMGICGGSVIELNNLMGEKGEAVIVVKKVADSLGGFGWLMCLLGVVALPVTSGDTAYRAARLIIADFFKLDQKPIANRLVICIPMFLLGAYMCTMDFRVVWRHMSWLNQGLAVFTLWATAVFLKSTGRNHWLASIPAFFMTFLIATFVLFDSKSGLGMSYVSSNILGIVIAGISAFLISQKNISEKS